MRTDAMDRSSTQIVARSMVLFLIPSGGGLTPVAQPLDSAPNCIVHKTVRDENTLRMLKQPLNARGYPDPPTRPQLARWVKAGWENVTETVIMRCFIRCGITRKCDYAADVRARHGLDGVKVSPVIADLVAAEDDFDSRSIFIPKDSALPPDEEEWMQEMSSILDMNMVNESELELLQDLRSGYEDLQYARELEVAEDEEAPAIEAEPSEYVIENTEPAPTLTEPDSIEGEVQPKKRRVITRFNSEQIAVLQREYDRGASRLSNKDIAMEIDMKPEGVGRKVVPDDVKNWMSAKARKARRLELLSSVAGQE